jgi:dihydroorotate dehydrogenase
MRMRVCALCEQNVTGLPIVGAGGFATGGGLVASLALGADGIAMGSRSVPMHAFMMTLLTTILSAIRDLKVTRAAAE